MQPQDGAIATSKYKMASPLDESASYHKTAITEDDDGYVFVYDRRAGDKAEVKINTGGMFEFSLFRKRVCQVRYMWKFL